MQQIGTVSSLLQMLQVVCAGTSCKPVGKSRARRRTAAACHGGGAMLTFQQDGFAVSIFL